MKKFGIIALVLVLALSLCACTRRKNETTVPTTKSTIPPTTAAPTIAPTMPTEMPTTNIPDPNVDPSHSTQDTNETNDMGITDGTTDTAGIDSAEGRMRRSNRRIR